MGVTKTESYSARQKSMAALAKALGHPARIAIVDHLLEVQECICGDLVNTLPLSQPTISQHLRELKTAGIIQGTIEGNRICYCLNPKRIHLLQKYLEKASGDTSKPGIPYC